MVGLSALILIAVITLAGCFLWARTLRVRTRDPETWPVHAKRVLHEREQVLYHRLRRAYPAQVVLAQVAVSQIVDTTRGKHSTAVFNRYSRLVADFVVCAPDFTPLAVFELDGRSHDAPARRDADARKDAVLAAAGIPLIRLNSRAANDEVDLHAAFPPPAARVSAMVPTARRAAR